MLSLLKNQQKFAKCHARTNHTSAHVSDDTSSLARVSDNISRLIRLCHMSLTPPAKLLQIEAFLRHLRDPEEGWEDTKIQKYKSFSGIKP